MTKNINAFETAADYSTALSNQSLVYPNVSYIIENQKVIYQFTPGFSARFYKRNGTYVDVMSPVVALNSNDFTNLGLTVNNKRGYDETDTDGQPTDIVEIRLGSLCEAINWNATLSKFNLYDGFPVSVSALTYTDDCQVEEIGYACLTRMSGLKKLVIPASVKEIGQYVDWLVNVEEIEFLGKTPPVIGGSWGHTDYNESCPIYCPTGTRDTYLTALQYIPNIQTRLQERVNIAQ